MKEKLWQERDNSEWFSNKKQKCDSCGDEVDSVIEYSLQDGSLIGKYCFLTKRHCSFDAMAKIFKDYPDTDFIMMRSIEFKKSV